MPNRNESLASTGQAAPGRLTHEDGTSTRTPAVPVGDLLLERAAADAALPQDSRNCGAPRE